MRFNKLDLNLLVALDILLAECSITRAADRLHISTSATSSALMRLREYFDDELLIQVGRKMERTPLAQALREDVRDVLTRIDATIVTRAEFVPSESDREFRLCVSDYTMATLMPHVLALAWRRAPKVRFSMRPQTENPQQTLSGGEADLLVFPEDYCSPDHPHERLFTEGFACVVWKGSTLAGRAMTFDEYVSAPHVVMQPLSVAMTSFEAWFMEKYGLNRHVDVTTYTFSSAAQLVVGTDRIATVHRRLARLMQEAYPVEVLPPPMPIPEIHQVMQWHKYRGSDSGLHWLRDLMREGAEAMDREIAGVEAEFTRPDSISGETGRPP
jgi:DNA-binding transcriptional LysR family regulator